MWAKCKGELERCEKRIAEEKKTLNLNHKWKRQDVVGIIIGCVVFFVGFAIICTSDTELLFGGGIGGFLGIFFATLCLVNFNIQKRCIKVCQRKIEELEAQLLGLQQNEKNAKKELNKIFHIPFKYWDEYALATMLQSIEDFEASNWERATDLYKEGEYRRIMNLKEA